MSMRLLTVRFVKHGRTFLRSLWSREIHTNILEQSHLKARSRRIPTSTSSANVAKSSVLNVAQSPSVLPRTTPNSGIFRVGQHARKLFIDNILNRVTTNYSKELRQQATKKLFYGDSAPFFALIGVSLASGAGVLSKEDELEGVCWEIREAAGRLQSMWNKDETDVANMLNSDFGIDHLDVGPPIAKGCAAVVYAAAFKNDRADANVGDNAYIQTSNVRDGMSPTHQVNTPVMQPPEYMSQLQNMSRFVHNFGGSVDNLYIYNQGSAAVAFAEELANARQQNSAAAAGMQSSESRENRDAEITGVRHNERSSMQDMVPLATASTTSISRYPLALKMMFNYDIQSNAPSILRAMYKETVPARERNLNESAEEWERIIQQQILTLPPHPNIVCMFGFFCDEVGNFPDGHILYPIAQPQRINPLGYGRNMSLYLLMKRYDLSLRNLLDSQKLSTRNKLLLLAQLLEAVTHISRHGIAHRDLKSDNILIEMNQGDDDTPPVLVLSDFGCCLADKVHGLQLPYNSYDQDKGGNTALMAPEIINKQPGPFAVLNYAKADLWACGAIAYEIFGMSNPFYSTTNGLAQAKGQLTYSLRNADFKAEDLPPLGSDCPMLVQELVYNILNPNPSRRVSPDIAANILQLYLWAPSVWLKASSMPSSAEILQWLLSLTTKVMCEGRPHLMGRGDTSFGNASTREHLSYQQSGRRTYVEYLLICSFLARARLRRIRGALNWIQNTVAA